MPYCPTFHGMVLVGLASQIRREVDQKVLGRHAKGLHMRDNSETQSVWLNQALTSGSSGREAYVTLLYGEDFLLGVRVLGQSLRETGTTRWAHPTFGVICGAGLYQYAICHATCQAP